MNCKKHPDEPAVSICSGCGCGLCAECDKEAKNTLCKSCRKDKKIDGIVSSAIYLALFGVAFFIGYKLNFFPADRRGESNQFFCKQRRRMKIISYAAVAFIDKAYS